MKNYFLLLFCCFIITSGKGQSIQQICQSFTTNGTIVNSEYFNDTLYATGFFNVICGQPVGYIAKWDNSEWGPTNLSLTDPGHSLEVIDDKLYIARYEESIDSNWVYVYENDSLQKFGTGIYLTTASNFSQLPNIYDVIQYDGKIVACGEFDRVGQESISGIMQWNGTNWESLGQGLSGNLPGTPPILFPHQMMVHNGELYVIGNFRKAGGVEVNGVAKWNGTEWMPLGAGFNNTVYSIIAYEDEIIAGGAFTQSGSTVVNRIAKWNGTEWVPLDFGFTPRTSNDFIFVHTLKIIEEVLYIGGGLKEIRYADNTTEICNGIISLDNDTINTFNGGVPNNDIEAVSKLADGRLLFGGGVFGRGYAGITDFNTSIQENKTLEAVKVYPNPFDTFITIDTEVAFTEFEIINEVGARVAYGNYENSIEVDLPAGFYYLKLKGQEAAYSIHKIVKLQ